MTTKYKFIITLNIFLLTLLFSIYLVKENSVKAQEVNFQIDPMLLQIEMKPESQFTFEYKLAGSKNVEYFIQAKAFIPKDNFGNLESLNENPDFIDWISYSNSNISFNNDREIQSVQMKIDIPADAKIKDYYFVTSVFSKEMKINQTGNILSGEIQSPVLLTVENIDNPSKREGKISNFSTPFFNFKQPINFNLIVENTGDLLFKSSGYITIQNLISKEVIKKTLLPQNVLAHSSRQIFNTTQTDKYPYITWYPEKTLFGIYKASAKITYPQGSFKETLQIQSKPIYFIYINLYLFLIIIVTIIIITILQIIRKRKKIDKKIDLF